MPPNEAERLAALRSYEVLDTGCEAAFDNLAVFAAKLTGAPTAVVSLVDADRQWFKARHGQDMAETSRDMAFCAHGILTPGQPLVVPDATLDPRFADSTLVTGPSRVRFYAGVPLVNQQGFALGMLCVTDTQPRTLSADQCDRLMRLAETVVTTLELRRAMIQVRHFALTDPLTGIANRPAFLETLDRAIARERRQGDPFALLYMDLDGFKTVNDTCGHAVGDQVLREVASVLRRRIRSEDTAARLGGDEFAALLVGGDVNGAPAAERIRNEVMASMHARGWPVTASIGAVTFRSPPRDAMTALGIADRLMYSAKEAGKNSVLHCEQVDAAGLNEAA
jgi:diguanylate cyclase (GGDEF)-like protein